MKRKIKMCTLFLLIISLIMPSLSALSLVAFDNTDDYEMLCHHHDEYCCTQLTEELHIIVETMIDGRLVGLRVTDEEYAFYQEHGMFEWELEGKQMNLSELMAAGRLSSFEMSDEEHMLYQDRVMFEREYAAQEMRTADSEIQLDLNLNEYTWELGGFIVDEHEIVFVPGNSESANESFMPLSTSGGINFPVATVGYGTQPTQFIPIHNNASPAMTNVTVSISSGMESFEITHHPPSTIPGWTIATIGVRPRTGRPAGMHSGTLSLAIQGRSPAHVPLWFAVNPGVTPTLTIIPSSDWNPATAGESRSISVNSNTSWTVSRSVTWLTLSSTSGSNNGSFTVIAAANTGTASRSGSVTVTGGSISRTFNVTQTGVAATRSISITTGTMTFTAQTVGYAQPAAQSTVITNTGNQITQQLTVNAPTGYQVSATQTGTFSNSITVPSISVGGTATFWTRPMTGRTVGTHTGNVTVANTSAQTPALTQRTRAVSFIVNAAATRSISLTSGTMTFPAQTVGYTQPAALSTVITNTGNQVTQQLTVNAPTGYQVSATQTGTFSNNITVPNISVGGTATFWTRPITGLAAGTHTGNVTVSNTTAQTPALAAQNRALSFTVNAAATRSISLTIGTLSFPAQTVDYTQPAAQSTVITNTGNQITQQLTVTAPTNFRVSATQNGTFSSSITISSIAVGGTATFWTRPITGLAAGTHTGNVTVANTTAQTPALTAQTRAASFTVLPIYTITYHANVPAGVTVSGMPNTQTKQHGVPINLSSAVPTRSDDFEFAGWSTSPDASPTSSGFEEFETFDAFFESAETHDELGITPTSTLPLIFGVGALFSFDMTINLYAMWRPTIRLTFNANGGAFPDPPFPTQLVEQVPSGSTIGNISTLVNPARTGYTFAGWFTHATGGTLVANNTPILRSATYWARWTPNFGISLNPSDAHTFASATVGYATAPTARTINASNTGNQATGLLTVSLSGTHPNSFTLSTTSLASIPAGSTTRSFTVRPRTGLAVGTHTAIVTVSGANVASRSISVRFTVNAAPPSTGVVLNASILYDSTYRNNRSQGVVQNELNDIIFPNATDAFDSRFRIDFNLINVSENSTVLNGGTCPHITTDRVCRHTGTDSCGNARDCDTQHCRSGIRLLDKLEAFHKSNNNFRNDFVIGVVGHDLCIEELHTNWGRDGEFNGAASVDMWTSISTAFRGSEQLAATMQHELTHNMGVLGHDCTEGWDCIIADNIINSWCPRCQGVIRSFVASQN